MNKIFIIIKKLLYTFVSIGPIVVFAWSIILLTQFYVASDLPKGIFVILWVVGCILILIRVLSINWIGFAINNTSEGDRK